MKILSYCKHAKLLEASEDTELRKHIGLLVKLYRLIKK
jgi:hypothetical protein